MTDPSEIVLCPYCLARGVLVVPIIAPAKMAAANWDHHPDCPNRND